MPTRIFVNLPVKNIARSVKFFEALGFSFDQQLTDDKSACMLISQNISAMLIAEPIFRTFTKKEVSDAKRTTEVLIALDAASIKEVDEIITKALKAGGSVYSKAQHNAGMYGHSFADLDGHQWEILYIEPESK